MNKKTVVLCYPVSENDVSKIRNVFDGCEVLVSSQEEIGTSILSADIFCGHAKTPVDWPRVVEQGKLKWIQSSAAGLDHCLKPAVIASDILVSGCSGLFANQVAEQTLALLYSATRRLPVFFAAQQQMEFERKPTDTIHNKNVAILGFGGNGRRIAQLLSGVANKIFATDPFDDFEVPDYVCLCDPNNTCDILGEADIVIVTLPLTDETKQCIGKREFDAMRNGCCFVNVARGQVVDQTELVEAIKNGKIGFACLDVVEPEPLPRDHELWSFSNVIITPHVGAQAANRVSSSTDLFCQNYLRFCQRQTLINQVDKEIGYPRPENRLTVLKNGEIQLPDKMA